MADEYVVRIVLDGVDNASDDIQRVDDELDNLGKSAAGANLDLAMFTGGMALTVGALNQFTGGLRKSHGAAERLGVGTQESRDQLAHYLDIIELIVGPLEAIIALFVLFGAGLYLCNTYHTSQDQFSDDSAKWDIFVQGFQYENEWDFNNAYQQS